MRIWCVILGLLAACEPIQPPPALPAEQPSMPRSSVRLAGDSVTTPLVERLVKVFAVRQQGRPITVETPLGVSGATRALTDGVIDGALVALPSTSPPPPGAVRIARSRVVLAVRGTTVRRTMTPEQLAQVITDTEGTWPDGLPRRFLMRPADDPLQTALGARLPAVGAAFARAQEQQIWPTIPQEDALRATLRVTPGAIAVADLGSLGLHGLPVWTLRVGEPVFVDLWLQPRVDVDGRLLAFMRWLTLPEAQELVRGLGYITVIDRRLR